MADYFARLQNCALPQRTALDLQVASRVFELRQDPALPANRHQLLGLQCVTTEVLVRNVGENDVAYVRTTLDHIIELLSFATESRVARIFQEYPAGSSAYQGNGASGSIQTWRPPFDDNASVKRFVELCYPQYVALRNPRCLHVAIDYIHHSVFHTLAAEIKIALACVTFECLRDNWARVDGYPHIDGFFRTKGATINAKGAPIKFKQHLDEMFQQVGIATETSAADAQRIVDIRNEVLHTGLFQGVHNGEHFEFLQTTLRGYLLRLLGYTGQYFAYDGGTSSLLTI